MSALRWAAVPLVVGVLTGNVASAAADEPPAAPAPTPAETPDPTPTAESTPAPFPPVTDSVVYITTTTTTTIVNAPITVVAAPITTTNNTTSDAGGAVNGALERFVMNLTGCGAAGGRSPTGQHDRDGRAQVRLRQNASLVVRVNGRRVTTLRLPSTGRRHPRGVALRLRLAPSGMLTIRRPSGRVLAVQGCTPE
jgi:hypothetical protein